MRVRRSSDLLFLCLPKLMRAPEASVMLDLARLHAYAKDGSFHLVDVPRLEAKRKRKELERQGFVIPHTELV